MDVPAAPPQRMQQLRRRVTFGGLLPVIALLVLLFSCGPRINDIFGGAGETEGDGSVFSIAGDTDEAMSPGAMVRIDLTMTNPHSKPMNVSDLEIALEAVTAPSADRHHPCSVADFAVGQAADHVRVTVPADSTTSLSTLGLARTSWPTVGMLDHPRNQDGCKGAIVRLVYSGSGMLQE